MSLFIDWPVGQRRITLTRLERSVQRRAGSWFGVGPVRSDQPMAEQATETARQWDVLTGELIGVAVHVGRHLFVLIWERRTSLVR